MLGCGQRQGLITDQKIYCDRSNFLSLLEENSSSHPSFATYVDVRTLKLLTLSTSHPICEWLMVSLILKCVIPLVLSVQLLTYHGARFLTLLFYAAKSSHVTLSMVTIRVCTTIIVCTVMGCWCSLPHGLRLDFHYLQTAVCQ